MPESMLVVIGACGSFVIVTCCMLVGIELHQAAAARALAERRWLEVKIALRKLLKELREK